MIMALLGVLALVFLLFWAMKKLNRRVTLSDSKCMVLGVTNGRVEKGHELEETEEELMKKDENGGNPTFKESFKIVFKDMLNKK